LFILDKLTEKAKDVLLELSKNNSSTKDAKSILEVINNSAGIAKALLQSMPKFKVRNETSIDLNTLVQEAFYESYKQKSTYVGTEHLLLALLKLSSSVDLNPIVKEINKLNSLPNFVKTVESQKRTPILDAFAVNLNKIAPLKSEKIIYREEVEVLVSILLQKDNYSSLIVGDLGVGKRSLVDLFVKKLTDNEVPSLLLDTVIFEFDIIAFISNFSNKEGLEYGISALTEELESFEKVILYFKNFQSIFIPTQGGLTVPLAFTMIHDQLKDYGVKLIGLMNSNIYEKVVAENEHVLDGFSVMTIDEPDEDVTKKIIKEKLSELTSYHNIKASPEVYEYVLEKTKELKSDKYPKKVVDVLDSSFTKILLKNSKVPATYKNLIKQKNLINEDFNTLISDSKFNEAIKVKKKLDRLSVKLGNLYRENNSSKNLILTTDEIDDVLEDMGNIKIGSRNQDFKFLSDLSEKLKKIIIGQNDSVETVVKSLIKARLGLRVSKRPLGSFLFLGPTGVGKTEFAKSLADNFYGANSLIRLDMSDFSEKHNVARLVGAPPGYIGFGDGGELTDKIDRNPSSVVLFDEIEKAHPDVLNILLQIMEEGELSDAKGQTFDFSKSVIILTSNIGTEFFHSKQIGLTKDELSKEISNTKLLENLKRVLRPELINRFDEVVTFNQLEKSDIEKILDIRLKELLGILKKQKIDLIISKHVYELLIEKGYAKEYGARALRRIVEKDLVNNIAEILLTQTSRPLSLKAIERDGSIHIEIRKTTQNNGQK
jgi:ATP-dependent Clp protease ATP-binding subunit ClpC